MIMTMEDGIKQAIREVTENPNRIKEINVNESFIGVVVNYETTVHTEKLAYDVKQITSGNGRVHFRLDREEV